MIGSIHNITIITWSTVRSVPKVQSDSFIDSLDQIVIYKDITLADFAQNFLVIPFAILMLIGFFLFAFALYNYIRDKTRDY